MRMTPELLALVAERFKAIADPTRLGILSTLRSGERTVSEIVDETGLNQANVSKHLAQLYTHGFVARRKEGLFVYYTLADKRVFQLCDIMCEGLQSHVKAKTKALAS